MSAYEKVYVPVDVSFDERGLMHPIRLTWQEEQIFDIDRVIQVRPAPSIKAGGQGDRYTVRIHGQETFLFFEHNTSLTAETLGRWFVEKKVR